MYTKLTTGILIRVSPNHGFLHLVLIILIWIELTRLNCCLLLFLRKERRLSQSTSLYLSCRIIQVLIRSRSPTSSSGRSRKKRIMQCISKLAGTRLWEQCLVFLTHFLPVSVLREANDLGSTENHQRRINLKEQQSKRG